jgi:hypothetical protein
VSAVFPGHGEALLTAPDGGSLCNSLRCARAGTIAEVIVTYGVLNDPGAGYYDRRALWKEMWHKPVPMCGACWQSSRQVAARYRPDLVVIDATAHGPAPAAAQSAGARG